MFGTNNDRDRLRAAGYSCDAAGHIYNRPGMRWVQERVAVIALTPEKDSRAMREFIDQIVDLLDEPRALRGTSKSGATLLLFKGAERPVIPIIAGHGRDNSRLALPTGERFTISVQDSPTVDVSAYKWDKSPLESPRDALPLLFSETVADLLDHAYTIGARHPEEIERERADAKRAEEMALTPEQIRRAINPTFEEMQEDEDARVVAKNEGVEVERDDPRYPYIVGARIRHGARLAREQEAAA